MIEKITNNRVMLNFGPIQMMLSASSGGRGMQDELVETANQLKSVLAELSGALNLAKDINTVTCTDVRAWPMPLQLMVEAVKMTGDSTLTPMAAVAGTFADIAADMLVSLGATKVLINNGGDIAVRLLQNEETKIGLTPSINASSISHILQLKAVDGIGGVATSGLGGRSFTKGIADAVTVLAENSRTADACATLIANSCFAEDPEIKQLPAEQLDPNTDIPGHLVTVEVGDIQPETIETALQNGISKARQLQELGIIRGAVLFIGPLMSEIPPDLSKFIKEV